MRFLVAAFLAFAVAASAQNLQPNKNASAEKIKAEIEQLQQRRALVYDPYGKEFEELTKQIDALQDELMDIPIKNSGLKKRSRRELSSNDSTPFYVGEVAAEPKYDPAPIRNHTQAVGFGNFLVEVFLFIGSCVLYILPSVIAHRKSKRNAAAITALNLLLGWTVVGWVVSLVWALAYEPNAEEGEAPSLSIRA